MANEDFENLVIIPDVVVDDGDGSDDDTDQHDPKYEISWYGANLDVDGLIRRFDKNKIYWPDFQRQFVWSPKQASRLIESILIGLPMPSLFLYKDAKNERSYIIDGLQRMMTLSAYKKGIWPESNPNARFDKNPEIKLRPFKLIGLSNEGRLNGKLFKDLSEDDRDRIDNTLIHVLFIEQRSPDDNHSSAFHIFDRLNSGGTPLQAQEMRNALYGGDFRKHLYGLSQHRLWKSMFGAKHKRARDEELILRFLSLCNKEEKYKQPMKTFLNAFMAEHKDADNTILSKFTEQFEGALKRIHDALGDDAFRPGRAFSAPYFDAFMVAVATDKTVTAEAIKHAYENLKKDTEFEKLVTAATTNETVVKKRIKMVRDAINAQ